MQDGLLQDQDWPFRRHLRKPFLALGLLLFIWIAFVLGRAGVDHLIAQSRHGISGTFTARSCAGDGRSWDFSEDDYRCTGTFVSSDGSVHIERIEYQKGFPRPIDESFPAKVSHADAGVAYPPTRFAGAQLIAALFFLALAFLLFRPKRWNS